jgi:hypothetical protein
MDAVPLELPPAQRSPYVTMGSLKVIVLVFLAFLVVSSEGFLTGAISLFGQSAMCGRSPTAWGVVLQGLFFVFFYMLVLAAVENELI